MRCHTLLILNKQTKKCQKLKLSPLQRSVSRLLEQAIKRQHAYHSHILTKKTKKQKRNLDHSTIVVKANRKQVLDCLALR